MTIVMIEVNVHIQEVGVNRKITFHILVDSAGYFVKKYHGVYETAGVKRATLLTANV